MDSKREVISYIKNVSTGLISLVFLLFPIIFLTNTTDAFILPKQLLVIFATLALAILWGIRIFVERKIVIRSTPFNLPVFLLGAVFLISALLSPDKYDSLIQAVPVVLVMVLYFVSINTIDDRKSFSISLSALSLGAVAAAVVAILYSFNIFIFPIEAAKSTNFNTFGSPIQLIAYILPVLLLSSFYVFNGFKHGAFKQIGNFKTSWGLLIQAVSSVVLVAGIAAVVYRLVTSPKPIFLPFADGFQIALASISRDAGRQVVSALFGSGYGTFLIDFNRFKLPTFNLNENLWNIPFSFSSSYFLEIVATTGILGGLAFIFLIVKVLKTRIFPINPLYSALLLVLALAFLIPFSFNIVFLLFVILAFYTAFLSIERDRRVDTVTVSLVALKEGLISVDENERTRRRSNSIVLPAALLLLILGISGYVGLYSVKFASADMTFAKSLSQQALQSGQQTYDLQRKAIDTFEYRSDYYRVFSRVNLALANSLASSVPQGSSPSAQTQQQVSQLLQQSINSGREAVRLAPASTVNWQNLAQIYRGLINVGQNAADFSVASLNQAIALDPSNPLLYVEMGGIFYQLKQYELAQQQFQVAVNLKPDYANARYNLGHAMEENKNLQGALQQYQIVRQLVANDKKSTEQIDKEIAALQTKIGENPQAAGQNQTGLEPNQGPQDLQIATPEAQLPAQEEEVKLPAPPPGRVSLTPTPSKAAGQTSGTPTPTETQ